MKLKWAGRKSYKWTKKKTELNSSIKFARDKIKKAAKRGVATEVRNAENVNRNLKTYSVKFGWEHEKK